MARNCAHTAVTFSLFNSASLCIGTVNDYMDLSLRCVLRGAQRACKDGVAVEGFGG